MYHQYYSEVSHLLVYVLYKITFIEITLPEEKGKDNRVFFLYFVASLKKASR
jgi:hypothetical protein